MVGVALTENKVTWVEKLKAQEWKWGICTVLTHPCQLLLNPVLATPLAYECEKPEDRKGGEPHRISLYI